MKDIPQNTFQYKGYKPIKEFSRMKTEDQLAAAIAMMIGLETQRPGTIAFILSRLSLVDGGFRMSSTVSDQSSERAMRSQKDFLDLLNGLADQ